MDTSQPKQMAGRSIRPVVWTAVVLGSLGVITVWTYGKSGSRPSDPLVVTGSLDLGEIWESERYSLKLPVQNTSYGTVEVTDFMNSCSCIGIEPRTFTLQSGEIKELNLVLDLSRAVRSVEQRNADNNPFEFDILPILKDGKPAKESWILKAQVRSPFRVSSSVIDLGMLTRGEPFTAATIEVICLCGASEVDAVAQDGSLALRVSRSSEDRSRYTVSVTPKDALPSGTFNTVVTITGVLPEQVVTYFRCTAG